MAAEATFLESLTGSRQAIGRRDWSAALELQKGARDLLGSLAPGDSDRAGELHRFYGELVNDLTIAIHGVVNTNSPQPLEQPRRAELCLELSRILVDHQHLPVSPPDWLPVLEQQVVQDGAAFWKSFLTEPGWAQDLLARAAASSLELHERLAVLLDPCPAWVLAEVEALRAVVPAPVARSENHSRPSNSELAATASRLWRDGPPAGARQLLRQLALVALPGEEAVAWRDGCLELNLHPWLADGDEAGLDRVVSAFFSGVRDSLAGAPTAQKPLLEPALEGMLRSLSVLWIAGSGLEPECFARFRYAAAVWHRHAGVGSPWQEHSSLPPLEPTSFKLLVELEPLELAAVRALVRQEPVIDPVLLRLSTLRQGGEAFPRNPAWWFDPTDPVESLGRLFEAGFPGAGTGDLPAAEVCRRWADGVLGPLMMAALWGEAVLWSSDDSADWFVLPLLQALSEGSGRRPELVEPPTRTQLSALLAERHVVVVTNGADGLRRRLKREPLHLLEPPVGLGYEEALAALVDQILGLHRQQPIDWVVASCGPLRLPLLLELQLRHGIRGLALAARHDLVELLG
ncbi:hypothetical protein KBZ18_01385 [Synechococcus sp. Cruz-9H2]|uniref:hypothetical protein n=1 Tax=unclassified Synechococcus TaxID=2626047 RepID=UPI0020CC07DC|nr:MULTISPECIES: hypothetical protein [unclassified Synechococcus]MCP9818143.1 hypothetical protein [Synechococcus sp. Cruz-9H2]MCP9842357.1 hypothetical protein [Synechococcus sp. Edmonson 11F2]MCP9854539.1 hypothetical protein [Synechococcus sp. Cruz-9C9]MCP9861765.1 hypothetical protein [Synechococcus sp. Cruz-7E5]MCP9869051.1 hypothetical protein [Synechococcus sp. Cruz-7B9]